MMEKRRHKAMNDIETLRHWVEESENIVFF